MSKVLITRDKLDDLAVAVAQKAGLTTPLTIAQMQTAVENLTPGGGTLITKNINANGTYDAEDDNADGYSSVTVNVPTPTLQTITKTYTPTESQQTETITAGSGYDGIEEVDVTVNAIPGNYVGSQVARNDSTDLTASGATVTAPAGYYASNATKTIQNATFGERGIDSNFSTVSGQRKWKATPYFQVASSGYAASGYVEWDETYDAVPSNTTITPTTSAQTIGGANTMMEGAVTVAAMPSGSATPAASISGTSATVSTGTNTLTLSKTVSNTPQVSAGYVSSGTAGNSNVSLTASVTTKAAATITPGTTNQTIASGTYLTGNQTISGDANLVAGNIKSGTSIFGVTGTYSGGGGTLTVATKTATLSAVGQTLSFTNLSGTPKYWFVKTTSQISSSGSTTIYYITDGFWDGTSVKGNSFRIGSTRRIYSWTSGVTQSYSGGTLTITGGSATGSSPGQFYNGTYELTYVY